jgi:hypothetical protein
MTRRPAMTLALLAALCLGSPSLAQHEPPKPSGAAAPADKGPGKDEKKDAGGEGMTPEQQAAWERASAPGPEHDRMGRMTGTWDCEAKVMLPGQPAQESRGRMVIAPEMGGRYQRGKYASAMMGMEFHGEFTLGHNNVTGEYESVWIDNMSTGMATTRGKMDGAELTLRGEYTDPATMKPIKVRETLRWVDDDTMEQRFFDDRGEGETESMSIVYHRVKDAWKDPGAGSKAPAPAAKPSGPNTGAGSEKPRPAGPPAKPGAARPGDKK